MTDDTYYDELGVTPQASRDELKAAYQERISELEAARDRKGVSDAQLQGNREQVARVRAAWNVLADPFQRSRYDERIDSASTNGDSGVEVVDGDDADGDDDASREPGVQLTGWRKLMAPPPPKATGAGNGKPPPPRRPLKEPTIPIPAGMRLADSRSRGMALLFDFAVVLVIYWVVLLVVPGVINSEYTAKVDSINHLNSLHDAQSDIDDAQSSINDADKAIAKAEDSDNSGDLKDAQSDKASAQEDLKSAQSDFNDAAKDVEKDDVPGGVKHNADAIQKQADTLGDDIRGAQYGSYLVVLVLAMLYLVPATVLTGRTLGMRGRRIRIVRVDGSPVGWYGAFVRFFVPIIVALAIPTIGPLLGLGMVLWGYRDANGQGIHDKLARTLVVADAQ